MNRGDKPTLTTGEVIAYLQQFPANTPITVGTPDGGWFLNLTGASDPRETDEPSIILEVADDFDMHQWVAQEPFRRDDEDDADDAIGPTYHGITRMWCDCGWETTHRTTMEVENDQGDGWCPACGDKPWHFSSTDGSTGVATPSPKHD